MPGMGSNMCEGTAAAGPAAPSKLAPCQPAPTWVQRDDGTHAPRVHQVGAHRPLGHIDVTDLAVSRAAEQLVTAAGGQEGGTQDVGGVALQEHGFAPAM